MLCIEHESALPCGLTGRRITAVRRLVQMLEYPTVTHHSRGVVVDLDERRSVTVEVRECSYRWQERRRVN
jgi:hypothetical protein